VRWPPTTLIGGAEPHDHLSLYSSCPLRSRPGGTPLGGGILPSDRCGGGRGPMGLTADDLLDVSQRGTTELHVNWGVDQRQVIQRLGQNHMLPCPNQRASWRSSDYGVLWYPNMD
jgi:hypothetical protein